MQPLVELRALHGSCSPSCITSRCRAEGIALRLPEQGALCISCDDCTCFLKGEGERKPDFIVLYCPSEAPSSLWFIIEMKGRVSDAGRVVSQIQAGAVVVQTSPCFRVTGQSRILVPIVVHGRSVRDSDFSRKRINFFGRRFEIFFKRSGDGLL